MPPVLRLGVVDALLGAPAADGGLPAVLARCVDALPGLRLHLAALRPLDIERSILSGALDAGVIAARAPASGLEQHLLYREPNSLYVAPGHPWYDEPDRERGDSELAQALFVSDPYCDDLPEAVLQRVGPRRAHTRADSIEGVALLVATGRFVGFLPEHVVQGTAALATLRPVQPARLSYGQDIVLTCRKGNTHSTLRMLLRQVASNPPTVAAAPGCPPAWSGSTPR
jgi:LysR family transcriptional regulator, transcriptional activator for bauABCD operon